LSARKSLVYYYLIVKIVEVFSGRSFAVSFVHRLFLISGHFGLQVTVIKRSGFDARVGLGICMNNLTSVVTWTGLDWVLSHWVHFTVHSLDLVVFICVYFVLLFFILHYVVLLSAQWGGSNGIEAQSLGPLFLQCFDTVGWVFDPKNPPPI